MHILIRRDLSENCVFDVGAFLIIVGSVVLLFIGSGWAEITRLGLEGAAMPHVVLGLFCLIGGFLMVCSERGPSKVKGILTWQSEGASPLWIHLLGLAMIILFFFLGWFSNPMFFIFSAVFVIAIVNDFKKLGLETGGHRWKSFGKHLYLGVFIASSVYLAFENVVSVFLSLGVFLVVAGFVQFSPYGKVIKKYTVFQDRYITLLIILISIIMIVFTQILRL